MIFGTCPKCNSSTVYFCKEGILSRTTDDKNDYAETGYLNSEILSYVCTTCGYYENYIAGGDVLSAIAMTWQKVGVGVGPGGATQSEAEDIIVSIEAVYRALSASPEAPARVLSYESLGFKVNEGQDVVSLELEVQPSDGPAFKAQAQAVIKPESKPKFQPGQPLVVRYNPARPNRVAIARAG